MKNSNLSPGHKIVHEEKHLVNMLSWSQHVNLDHILAQFIVTTFLLIYYNLLYGNNYNVILDFH